MYEVEDGEIIDLDSIPLPSGQPQPRSRTPEEDRSLRFPDIPQVSYNLAKKWTPAVKNYYGRSRNDHSRDQMKGALPQSSRRSNKQGPIWIPERESKSKAPKPLTREHPFFDQSPRSKQNSDNSKDDEEDDVLKIMHMLEDNPTLKDDLRTYFKDNLASRSRGSRKKKKKAKAHSFEDLMNDYHTLVEKQEKSGSKVRNSPSDHDLDGEVLNSSRPALLPTPPIEKIQGFKSTFQTIDLDLDGDIYSSTPMDLDSDEEPPYTELDGQPLTPRLPPPPFPGPPPPLHYFPPAPPVYQMMDDWMIPTQVYTPLDKLSLPEPLPAPLPAPQPEVHAAPDSPEYIPSSQPEPDEGGGSMLDQALYQARLGATSSPEEEREVKEDSYASEDGIEDEEGEEQELQSSDAQELDLAALRIQLLHSMKDAISSKVKNKSKLAPKQDLSMLPLKESTSEVITVNGSSSEGDISPLAKRHSKRKMTDSHLKRKQRVGISEALSLVKRMPVIDSATFKKFYCDKKGDLSKKKALDRAERLQITRLELLKDELYFNPFKKRWYVISMNTSKIPKDCISYKELSCHQHQLDKDREEREEEQRRLDKLTSRKQEKLDMFYDLVANIGTGETPVVTSPQKSIDPKLLEQHILNTALQVTITKQPSPERLLQSLTVSCQQPPTPHQSPTPPQSPEIPSGQLSANAVRDTKVSAEMVTSVQSKETGERRSRETSGDKGMTRSRETSGDKGLISSRETSGDKGLIRSRETSGDKGLIRSRETSGDKGLSLEKSGDKGLSLEKIGATELVPTSRELGENQLPLVMSGSLMGVEIDEQHGVDGVDGVESIAVKTLEVQAPGTEETEETKETEGAEVIKKREGSKGKALDKVPGKSRKMSEDDNLDVMRELLLQSMIKKGSRGKDSIVQETAVLPPVQLDLRRPSPPPTTAINEALMPRDLSTTTKEEIKRSSETTKRIIAEFRVNEDLRRPAKENFITPEQAQQKKLLLKRITPVIRPVVIDISDGESDSSQSDQALTPVKQFISNEARAERVKKCDERDRLALQAAHLERSLVKYTHTQHKHLLEHQKHVEKLKQLEIQYVGQQKLVSASHSILKALDGQQKKTLQDLKRATALAADMTLQIENPTLWRQRRYSNSSEKCPLLPSPVAAQQSLSIIDGKMSPKRLEFKETEEEVQEEKAVESESSVEEEGELLSEGEQDRERDARQDSVPIASAEELLARYSAPHNATPHNATLDNTSILSDWFTETKLPQIKFWDSSTTSTTPLLTLNSSKYKSPLVMFRSYRFSPYFRTKHGFQLNSPTFSHNIDHSVALCPHDLHGKCKDKNCARQHIEGPSLITGAEIRTQLCQSVGLAPSVAAQFDLSHPSLNQAQLSLLFCHHINKIRTDRKKDYNFINTAVIPKKGVSAAKSPGIKETLDSYCHRAPTHKGRHDKGQSERYYDATEVTLTKQCKLQPKSSASWLELARCQIKRGATPSVVSGTLSRALQHNKHCPELWAEFLTVKAPLVSSGDLSTLYTQAVKLAPSPVLWSKLAPTLATLPARLDALAAALSACDSSKSKSALCRGDIRKARLWLLERGGMGLQEEFQSILNELAEYQDEDILWVVLQYVHYLQTGFLTPYPHKPLPPKLTAAQGPEEALSHTLTSSLEPLRGLLTSALSVVGDQEVVLKLHRLKAGVQCLLEGTESAIRYLSSVTEASASLFELMQDIVLRGGWVEPDITWPRLCCTQMEVLVAHGQKESALALARGLALAMCGLESDVDTDTLTLFREMLGLSVGVAVTEDLLCFTQPPHNTWLYLCYGYTAKLSLHSPLSSDTHSPLSILKNAIAVETTTQGVYLLWTRYFEYLEDELESSPGLSDTLVSDMVHCLKTVPTLHERDYTFHNSVIIRLLSHVPEEFRAEHLHKLTSLLPDNAELVIRCAHQEAKTNPKSAVVTLKEHLLSHPTDAHLWIMLIQISETCHPALETRRLAAEALSHNPLHATLLKQVFLFELQAAHDAVQKKQLAQWSFNYATEKGIQLKI